MCEIKPFGRGARYVGHDNAHGRNKPAGHHVLDMTLAHAENNKSAQKKKVNNHSRKPQVFACEREKASEGFADHHRGHRERGHDAAQDRMTQIGN